MMFSADEIKNKPEIYNLVKNIIILPFLFPNICIEYNYSFYPKREFEKIQEVEEFLNNGYFEYFQYQEPDIETFNPESDDFSKVEELFERASVSKFYHCNPKAENICVFSDKYLFKNFNLSFYQKLPEIHPFNENFFQTLIYIGDRSQPDLDKINFYDRAIFAENLILNHTSLFLENPYGRVLLSKFHNDIAKYNFTI